MRKQQFAERTNRVKILRQHRLVSSHTVREFQPRVVGL